MVEIYFASENNFEEIFELLIKLYSNNQLDRTTTFSIFQNELRNKTSILLIAKEENKIIGFASSSSRLDFQEGCQISVLTNLIVSEEFRNLGVGSLLLEEIEKESLKIGSKELHFSSTFKREKSHQFYESKGYKKTAYYFWKKL